MLDGSWGGCWASPDPPGPASVFTWSIRRSIRKSANYTRILPVGTTQTGAVYILDLHIAAAHLFAFPAKDAEPHAATAPLHVAAPAGDAQQHAAGAPLTAAAAATWQPASGQASSCCQCERVKGASSCCFLCLRLGLGGICKIAMDLDCAACLHNPRART